MTNTRNCTMTKLVRWISSQGSRRDTFIFTLLAVKLMGKPAAAFRQYLFASIITSKINKLLMYVVILHKGVLHRDMGD